MTRASADPAIEGIWLFNGGRIAVQQQQQPGVFVGTVVDPTTFSLCTHPSGEEIWTQMTRQPDGSYWGTHQWFFETSQCTPNLALGQTAWRVLQKAQGRYLRVCFSEPGSSLQPTISPSGEAANATYGCVNSELISEIPELSADDLVQLPSNKSCLRRRELRIRITEAKNDPIQKVVVTARSDGVKVKAKIQDTKKGMIAVLPLAALPGDAITVKVRLTTLLGQHLKRKRTYHRCASGGGGR